MKKLLLVLCLTMVPMLAHGATYYVAKTGSDSNSCSSAQSQSTPKLTINAGIRCLSASDTLIIKAGTYDEHIYSSIPSETTVRSEVQYGAIIKPSQNGNIVTFADGVSQSNITFDGFVIDGSLLSPSVYSIVIRAQGGTASNITISNNELRNNPGASSAANSGGMLTGFNTSNIVFRGNKIHDMGMGQNPGNTCNECSSYGIYLAASGFTIENNEFYNISGYAIHGYDSAGGSSNNIIRNNYFHNNSFGLTDIPTILLACGGADNQFYNNIVANNSGRGLLIGGYCAGNNSTNNLLYNNTFYGNRGLCIQVGNPNSANNNTVRNNICWQNGSDNITVSAGSSNTLSNNLTGQNPLVSGHRGTQGANFAKVKSETTGVSPHESPRPPRRGVSEGK